MTISALPPAPLITDAPSVFDSKSSTFVAALPTLVTEMNAAIASVNMTKWISGTTYAIGDVTWSPATFFAYRRKTAGAGTTDPSADATNWISIASAAAGPNADITSMTALTAINRTGGTSIKGTNTNNNAAAGDVGEYIESTIGLGSAVSLTTGVVANITSISLTAGDWDVSGVIIMDSGATTNVTRVMCGINSTSATVDVTKGYYSHIHSGYVPGSGQFRGMPLNTSRFSLSATTTIYLLALSNFTVSTCSAYGTISARRVR